MSSELFDCEYVKIEVRNDLLPSANINQYGPSSMTPYDVAGSQWGNS